MKRKMACIKKLKPVKTSADWPVRTGYNSPMLLKDSLQQDNEKLNTQFFCRKDIEKELLPIPPR